jgi:hypothetical protein
VHERGSTAGKLLMVLLLCFPAGCTSCASRVDGMPRDVERLWLQWSLLLCAELSHE